jgi:hypothetical protein
MFSLKGTVWQDFLLQVFFMNHLPPGLGKATNLWTYIICYICVLSAICIFAIYRPNIFCNFQICDLLTQIFAGLKLLQICKFFIFLLTNTYLKCSNSNFYQIKNSAKQTSSWLLDGFAIKGMNFLKRCAILSVFWWKICGFAICGLAQRPDPKGLSTFSQCTEFLPHRGFELMSSRSVPEFIDPRFRENKPKTLVFSH